MTNEERLADIVSRVDMGLGDGRGDGADTMWLIARVRELEATAISAGVARTLLDYMALREVPRKTVLIAEEKLQKIAHPEPQEGM